MVLLALGSNLSGRHDSPESVLREAVHALCHEGIRVLRASSIWLTEPVPASDDPWYRNAVIEVDVSMAPQDLMKQLKNIENDFGRRRDVRNAPRVLDLDILDYNGEIMTGHDPSLPHPRMHERGFVLFPLNEICPEWIHPVFQKNVGALIAELKTYAHVQKTEGEEGRLL